MDYTLLLLSAAGGGACLGLLCCAFAICIGCRHRRLRRRRKQTTRATCADDESKVAAIAIPKLEVVNRMELAPVDSRSLSAAVSSPDLSSESPANVPVAVPVARGSNAKRNRRRLPSASDLISAYTLTPNFGQQGQLLAARHGSFEVETASLPLPALSPEIECNDSEQMFAIELETATATGGGSTGGAEAAGHALTVIIGILKECDPAQWKTHLVNFQAQNVTDKTLQFIPCDPADDDDLPIWKRLIPTFEARVRFKTLWKEREDAMHTYSTNGSV